MTFSDNYEPLCGEPALTSEEISLLQADRPGYGTRSNIAVSFNLVNATIGAGVLGLPLAMLYVGFIHGLVLLAIVGVLTFLAIYMMVMAGKHANVYTFAAMGEYALGRQGFHMVNLMLFIQSAGSCISYFILIADTIPGLMARYLPQLGFFADRERTTILLAIFVIFPLNLPRSIGSMASWSTFSVLLLPIVLLTVLIRAPVYAPKHEAPLTTAGQDPFAALGMMSFAMVCAQVAFSNFLTQKNQSAKAWRFTSGLSVFISWLVCTVLAVIGYLSFGKDVDSNIFNNFPADDNIINVGRLALAISIILTVPMAFYPGRDALQKALGFERADKQPTTLQHYGVSVVLFAVLLAIGVKVHSLGKVFSTVGGIASAFLAYMVPGLAYLATFKPWKHTKAGEYTPLLTGKMDPTQSASTGLSIASVILVGFGSLLMVMTLRNVF